MNLDATELIKAEIMRQTAIGLEMHQMDLTGKPFTPRVIVKML